MDLNNEIPATFSSEEVIVRGIYTPCCFNSKGDLHPNAFKSAAGTDEVSVLRLNYCTPDFCKDHSKSIENPAKQRTYKGLAAIQAKAILKAGAKLIYSPLENNCAHAHISIEYVVQKGQSLPAEFNYKLKEMVKYSNYREDPDPNSQGWKGAELIGKPLDS